MKRLVPIVTLAALLALPSATLAWGHHGWGGPHVFFGGVFAPYPYPYPYPYYAPYPVYAYPPPPTAPPPGDPGWGTPSQEPERAPGDAESSGPPDATYGLVQLRGIPDGASIDLDGRFWLRASDLDRRWLALPDGRHRITVHVGEARPVDRVLEVAPGKSQVVRLGPFARATS